MNQQLIAGLLFCGLASASFASDPGWFVETPVQDSDYGFEASLQQRDPVLSGPELVNLRAGYRFSENFTLSAALDEYLLDVMRIQNCSGIDFVCLAVRERAIDHGTVYTLALAPSLKLDDDLSVYGRFGLQGWKLNAGQDDRPHRRELMFGVGLRYDLAKPFRLKLEYQALDLDIKLTSIGFSWRF